MSNATAVPDGAANPSGTAPASPAVVRCSRIIRLAVPLALIALILLVFMPTLDAGLVGWDDDDLLWGTSQYQAFGYDNVRWMFTTSYAGHFQPLTWLTFALNWAIWRREVFGYHLTSVLLHACTAIVFYFLVRRLLVTTLREESAEQPTAVLLSAGFAAAVFAVHPLRAEPVSWLASGDVLAGLFYLLAVLCYLRYAGAGGEHAVNATHSSRPGSYWLSLVLCGVSLLAKATAVTMPIVLLILDVFPLRRWRPGARDPSAADGRRPAEPCDHAADLAPRSVGGVACPPSGRIWLEKIPFILLAMAGGARGLIAREQGGAVLSLTEYDLPARFAQACYGLVFYIWKTVWPTDLGPLYHIPPRETLFGPMLWASLACLALIVGVIVVLGRRMPSVLVALAIYIVLLIPVLGFVQSGPQLVADRYSYLSCLGLAMLAGGCMMRVLCSRRFAAGTNGRSVLALVTVALLTVLGKATFAQTEIWVSAESLWEKGVRVSPGSSIAHTNYADALVASLQYRKAEHHYQRALELNPNDSVALHHRGDLYRRLGRYAAAKAYYIQALRLDPSRWRACLSLAQLLNREGKAEAALAALRDGARRRPDALNLIAYLSDMLATHPDRRIRNGQEAVKWATHVSGLRGPDHPPSLLILATAYAENGQYDQAVDTAQRTLDLAGERGLISLMDELQRRLALFQLGLPYHRSGHVTDTMSP